jgi:hypothetical protein
MVVVLYNSRLELVSDSKDFIVMTRPQSLGAKYGSDGNEL